MFSMPLMERIMIAADLPWGFVSMGLSALPWKLDHFPELSLRKNAAPRRAVLRSALIVLAHAKTCKSTIMPANANCSPN
jgi:hypothetical protein